MAESDVVITVTIDDNGVQRSFKAIEGQAKDSGEAAGTSFGKIFGATLLADLAASGIKKIFSELGQLMKDSVKEAIEGERAMSGFAATMRAMGQGSQEAIQGFASYAEELEKLTGIQDDLILQNASVLVSIGKLKGEGLEKAAKAATDLAAGLSIDVGTAFDVMAKAAAGNVTGLQKWGLVVSANATEAEKYAAALNFVNTRFKDLGQAKMDTFEGAVMGMSNGFKSLEKSLGAVITQSPMVRDVVKSLGEWFRDAGDWLKGFTKGRDVIAEFTQWIVKFGQVVVSFVIAPIESAGTLIYTVFESIANKLASVMAIMMAAVDGNFGAMKAGIDSLFSAEGLTASIETPISNAMSNTLGNIETQTILAQEKARMLGEGIGTGIKEGLIPPMDEATKKAMQLRDAMANIVSAQTLKLVSGGVQMLGASLLKGGSAFDAFKGLALNSLGDMTIGIGEMMIKQSAAFAALQAMIMNPLTAAPASLAFGLALVALGGLMKAAAGGSGAGASSGASIGGGGGVTATDSGAPTSAVAMNETTMQKPQNQLVVNVQGSVLTDRREAGLYLAEVLQETLLTNGVLTTA